jgi:glycosyltransferase involved in cell wall biosynthesis
VIGEEVAHLEPNYSFEDASGFAVKRRRYSREVSLSSAIGMAKNARVAVFIFNLTPGRLGGIEIHTREVVRRMGEQGWRAILCFCQAPSPEVLQYLSLPNVTLEALPNARQTSQQLGRILRRYRPSLLHLHFTPLIAFTAWIARLSGVKRIVYTDHLSRPEGYQPKPAPLWKRVIAKFLTYPISAVIGVSNFNCRVLSLSGFVSPARVHRIYNSTDLARSCTAKTSGENFRRRYNIPLDRILVTQVSWIIPQKGISDVLEAAVAALSEAPALHFAFVGEGDSRAEYERRAIEAGISGHVTWTGPVCDPIGEGVFAATDISCQASRWQEAFGLAIAEAMGSGKPVVATRVGAIPELVLDGETGFLVPPRDAAALAEKIVLLARDRALRQRLGQAGRRRAEQEFDIHKNVGVLLDFYRLS